jgi:trans-aconitate 2-methyltransferase
MTEWNAEAYSQISELQRHMADEVLSLLEFRGAEHVLDVGCGNGRITVELARRVPQGSVVGVDASAQMIALAQQPSGNPVNLQFMQADARDLPFHQQFDFVVSLNALHWVPDQERALRSIHSTMKPGAKAHLRLVPRGPRESLEDVLEETRLSSRWAKYFQGFTDPYLHLSPEQYTTLAERCGFKVLDVHSGDKAWDFRSRAAFEAFGSVTFISWTERLPEAERPAFVSDVLDRYSKLAERPEEENTFKFYQMDVALTLA